MPHRYFTTDIADGSAYLNLSLIHIYWSSNAL